MITMTRKSEYNILEPILSRWSPRAFTPEEIPDSKLFAILEAGRWAPSSYNGQLWRFIYAKRDTEEWNKMFSYLVEFNQSWVKNASALILIITKKNFDNGSPSITHQFDAGAAWQNIALEAQHQGYHAHGMSGFDYGKAKEGLNISDEYEIMAMIAIGKNGSIDLLPEELKENEVMSDRKSLQELIFKGEMK